MHICQIEIDNFKSFAEKTVIPFERGFTTVSGPNGSGKSNIIDSILFCLGLSTSRTMRAEKLSDLVNNLSKRKEASVTITFRRDKRDRALEDTHQLSIGESVEADEHLVEDAEPVADSDSEEAPAEATEGLQPSTLTGDLVQITRRIRGNASGYTSTYYINGKPTTLTEIHDVLGQFNISPGTYNVMMQGDVQGIVNMSAMERRKIIDEIAGVAEFDRKIDQAQKELELTGVNIEHNTILLTEISVRLEQLSAEREHALKYRKLRDEKQNYEGLLKISRYLDLKKSIAAANQNIAEARRQKESTQELIRQLVDEIAQTREELLRLSNEVKKKGEDQQIALKKQIEGLKGHIARKEDAVRFIEEKNAENAKRIEQMKSEIARQQANIETVDAEIAGFHYQLKELQGLFGEESKNYEKLNQKFDALTGSGGELSIKRNEVRQKLAAAEDAASLLNRQKLDVEAEVKRNQYEMDLRLRNNTEGQQKIEKLLAEQERVSQAATGLEMEKGAFEKQLKTAHLDYSKTRVDLTSITTRYNELNREYMLLEAKQRAMEEVSFSRAVETVLNSDLKGVHGTLAQLADVVDEYALSLEIAMGARVQNVIVDDEGIAQDGIELLQRQKAGRATFLPLTKIKRERGLPPVPNYPGVVDWAFNLIDCDGRYDDIFAYAVGDTLIVEDMASARPLLRKYRMVTLDGSLLEKSGAMTGGSVQSRGRGGNIFSGGQANQAAHELEGLGKRLDALEAEKVGLEKKLTQLELKMESVKGEYDKSMALYNRMTTELELVERQLAELREQEAESVDVSDLKAEMARLSTEIDALETSLSEKQKTITELQAELAGIESQLPADKIEALRQEMTEVKFQMDYYDSQIRNVQAEIKGKEMEKNYQAVGITDYQTRIQEAGQAIKDSAKEKEGAFEEIKLTQLQINELEAQTTELDEELKKLQEERDVVQAQLIEQEKNKNIKEREITQLDEQVLSFQTRKRELEPQLAAIKAELEASEIEIEAIQEDELPSEQEVIGNIQRLTRKMEAMEPVNMLAIDEYDRVNERRDELAEKIDTLNQEKDTLHVKIAGYHELKLASFRKAFESVDGGFRGIFAELSDGQGELILTNPENPFEGGMTIHAQPRGKKMQRIEAMSGGEKSLTSLAFVFALQRYMPAPFYALDEVDMNLDGINAEKLSNMVKRESRGAQFIVVSLRKPMIENSERTIGVTQKRNGITKVTGIKHRDGEYEDEALQMEEVMDHERAAAS